MYAITDKSGLGTRQKYAFRGVMHLEEMHLEESHCIWTIYFYLSKFMDISGLVRFVQVFGLFWQHPHNAAQLSLAVLLGFHVLRNRRISCDGAEITEEYVVLSLDPHNKHDSQNQ